MALKTRAPRMGPQLGVPRFSELGAAHQSAAELSHLEQDATPSHTEPEVYTESILVEQTTPVALNFADRASPGSLWKARLLQSPNSVGKDVRV